MIDCCSNGSTDEDRVVLLYACSGGANVAEAADRAARELMYADKGGMFCLAGLGAGVEGMVQAARDADLNVVIDGCGMDCAKRIFDNLGLTNYVQVKVTDLGIDKAKGAACDEEDVVQTVEAALAAMERT